MSIFTNKDYNSPDGMLTYVWGPPMWHSLHTISFNYPVKPSKEVKDQYYNYFLSLGDVLPCKYCRDNYKDNLKKLKFGKSIFKNRDILSKFVFNLHEMINKNLGKKSNLNYNTVRDRYENFRARCINDKKIQNNVKEKGCTTSLYGQKSKCLLKIVPKSSQAQTLTIDPKCIIKKK